MAERPVDHFISSKLMPISEALHLYVATVVAPPPTVAQLILKCEEGETGECWTQCETVLQSPGSKDSNPFAKQVAVLMLVHLMMVDSSLATSANHKQLEDFGRRVFGNKFKLPALKKTANPARTVNEDTLKPLDEVDDVTNGVEDIQIEAAKRPRHSTRISAKRK